MTSPSFRADTSLRVKQNQGSWSHPIAMKVGGEVQLCIRQVAAEGQAAVARLNAQLAQARARLPGKARLIAGCEARMRWCERNVARLPRR